MRGMESLPAQEFKAPFRVDPIGLARKAEQEAQKPTGDHLNDIIAAAGTAGAVITESEVDLVA